MIENVKFYVPHDVEFRADYMSHCTKQAKFLRFSKVLLVDSLPPTALDTFLPGLDMTMRQFLLNDRIHTIN